VPIWGKIVKGQIFKSLKLHWLGPSNICGREEKLILFLALERSLKSCYQFELCLVKQALEMDIMGNTHIYGMEKPKNHLQPRI